jgi:hypothetical protein
MVWVLIPQPPEPGSRAQPLICPVSDSHVQIACCDLEPSAGMPCAFDLGAWGKKVSRWGSGSEVGSAVMSDLCREITSIRFCSNERWGHSPCPIDG